MGMSMCVSIWEGVFGHLCVLFSMCSGNESQQNIHELKPSQAENKLKVSVDCNDLVSETNQKVGFAWHGPCRVIHSTSKMESIRDYRDEGD